MEPIAALSSAPGTGAVALLRVSGEGVHDKVSIFLKGLPKSPQARVAYYCQFYDGDVTIDDVVALFFAAPQSYTGEDVVEIMCHGSVFVTQKILAHLWQQNIRPAAPGEFTRRAFLNGKMDLVEAEGVAALIEAQSQAQWEAARSLTEGRLSAAILALREQLIEAMAYLEARIDFPEENDTSHITVEHTVSRVRTVLSSVEKLVQSYQSGKVAIQGMRVALVGPPNAGKSTLLNTFLGQERSIVTAIAGTTRDYIEERCLIDGRLISLVDTAGLRSSHDLVETMGVDSSKKLAKECDLILFISSSDVAAAETNAAKLSIQGLDESKCIFVHNKSDLATSSGEKNPAVHISCHTGEGMENLRRLIVKRFDNFVGSTKSSVFITSTRHLHALSEAQRLLQSFLDQSQESFDECLAFELQEAARRLYEMVGDISQDDVLDRIFSSFCVGK